MVLIAASTGLSDSGRLQAPLHARKIIVAGKSGYWIEGQVNTCSAAGAHMFG
jgi:hypothetical protein